MRTIALILLLTLLASPACETTEGTDDGGFANVFPDGTIFTDGGLILPDGHVCIGVDPPASAYGASPGPVADVYEGRPDADASVEDPAPDDELSEDPCVLSPGTCVGAPPPQWDLADFQPQSCGFGGVYGLDVFKGRPTVAVLLAAW